MFDLHVVITHECASRERAYVNMVTEQERRSDHPEEVIADYVVASIDGIKMSIANLIRLMENKRYESEAIAGTIETVKSEWAMYVKCVRTDQNIYERFFHAMEPDIYISGRFTVSSFDNVTVENILNNRLWNMTQQRVKTPKLLSRISKCVFQRYTSSRKTGKKLAASTIEKIRIPPRLPVVKEVVDSVMRKADSQYAMLRRISVDRTSHITTLNATADKLDQLVEIAQAKLNALPDLLLTYTRTRLELELTKSVRASWEEVAVKIEHDPNAIVDVFEYLKHELDQAMGRAAMPCEAIVSPELKQEWKACALARYSSATHTSMNHFLKVVKTEVCPSIKKSMVELPDDIKQHGEWLGKWHNDVEAICDHNMTGYVIHKLPPMPLHVRNMTRMRLSSSHMAKCVVLRAVKLKLPSDEADQNTEYMMKLAEWCHTQARVDTYQFTSRDKFTSYDKSHSEYIVSINIHSAVRMSRVALMLEFKNVLVAATLMVGLARMMSIIEAQVQATHIPITLIVDEIDWTIDSALWAQLKQKIALSGLYETLIEMPMCRLLLEPLRRLNSITTAPQLSLVLRAVLGLYEASCASR